jgi:mannose-6-phosphate isomerase-like protein (cupin superfamily)/lysophospholipase L1-like esterase
MSAARLQRLLLALALLSPLPVAAGAAQPQDVFIIGDATASGVDPARAPREGWGQYVQSWFNPAAWRVHNHAQPDHGARSFVAAGLLAPVERELGRGDVLLIQFGHDGATADAQELTRLVRLARERQATPILVTPLTLRRFEAGRLADTPAPNTLAVRDLARREGIALIDVAAASANWLRALGPEASRSYYVPAQPQGTGDTDLQRHGAYAVACMVVDGWKKIDASLSRHVVRDTDCGAHPTALANLAAQSAPSLIAHERDLATAQPGPHGGAGETTAYPFFADAPGLNFIFRKRVLHAGAGIGLHQHDHDEIYYVISGRGIYTLDGREHEVGPGHALLVRTGSTHGIRQVGAADLELIIAYPR